MAISVTQTNSINTSDNLPKKRSVYDNYDKLKAVVHYDVNNNVDFVLKASNNNSGKSLQTKKYQQVHVDVIQAPTNITFDSATLNARIYKNDNSTVYETGFLVWEGAGNESVLDRQEYKDTLTTPTIYKGSFSKRVENLTDNRTYNYRAFVKHEYGTNYSKVYTFTTVDFNTVFSIAGDKFSGPTPLTVNLTGINAGPGNYTYAWNMTGGSVSFEYSVSGITITSPGSGYEPDLIRFALTTIAIDLTGAGYDPLSSVVVLVNDTVQESLSANFAYNGELDVYGISSVEIPAPLSGYTANSFTITFSTETPESITEAASGTGNGVQYIIPREFLVLINNTPQPSLSVVNAYNEALDTFEISAVEIPAEIFGFIDSSRTVTISTNEPVSFNATASASGNIQVLNADYLTRAITHTYLSGGTFTPKVYAILEDVVDKEATRTIRVNTVTDFTAEWSTITNSSFANNVIGAYDFRNIAGTPGLIDNAVMFYKFTPIAGYSGIQLLNYPNDLRYNGGVNDFILYRNRTPFSPGWADGSVIGGYDQMFTSNGLNGNAIVLKPHIGGYGEGWTTFSTTDVFNSFSPFTLSMWVNYATFATEPGTKIFSIRTNEFASEFGITQSSTALRIFKNLYYAEEIGNAGIGGYNEGYGWPVLQTTDTDKMLTPNTWNHIVITRDSNSNYKYYLNGQLALENTDNYLDVDVGGGKYYGGIGGYGTNISIGMSNNYGTRTGAPSGLIDNVGIWKRELTLEDVEALYNDGQGLEDVGFLNAIVGPKLLLAGIAGYNGTVNTRLATDGDQSWNNVSLLLQNDGNDGEAVFTDSSLNSVPLTANNGAVTSTEQIKFGTTSGKFVGGYLTTPKNDDYAAFGTDAFTIEWWDYLVGGYSFNRRPIFNYGNPGYWDPPGGAFNFKAQLGLSYSNDLNTLQVFIGGYGQAGTRYDMSTGGRNQNEWTHNALVRDGGTWRYFKNGVVAGYAGVPGYINIARDEIGGYGTIGGYGPGVGTIGGGYINGTFQALSGYIDDFRITKGVARYPGNFTVPVSAFQTELGNPIGMNFTPNTRGSYAESLNTISVTYPHTVAFIGKASSLGGDVIYKAVQPIKWSQTNNQNIWIFSRSFQGLMPYNGLDNLNQVNYTPNGSEWFYIAYSFLGQDQNYAIRYHLQTPTVTRQGTIGGSSSQNFNGFVSYGRGGFAGAGGNNINGTARLGMFINQGFTTHEDMLTLFNAITAGPAQDIPLA